MEYSQDDFNAFGGFGGAMESGPGGPAPQGHNRSGPGEQQYSAVNNVGLWQEQNYMAGNESGFHSNATSQPSSRTGHEDGLEDGFHTGPGSLYDMDSIAPSGKYLERCFNFSRSPINKNIYRGGFNNFLISSWISRSS